MNVPDTIEWALGASTQIRELADRIASAPVPTHLGSEHLLFAELATGSQQVIERLTSPDRIDRDRCIYIFALDDEADPQEVQIAFRKARGQTGLKLPQDNKTPSRILYVGSSCATMKRSRTLRTRLRQHLISDQKGTYALSLSQWVPDVSSGGIIVSAWQYPSLGDGEEADKAAREIVLSVEDWLSSELKPMLGRRGSRH